MLCCTLMCLGRTSDFLQTIVGFLLFGLFLVLSLLLLFILSSVLSLGFLARECLIQTRGLPKRNNTLFQGEVYGSILEIWALARSFQTARFHCALKLWMKRIMKRWFIPGARWCLCGFMTLGWVLSRPCRICKCIHQSPSCMYVCMHACHSLCLPALLSIPLYLFLHLHLDPTLFVYRSRSCARDFWSLQS